MKTLTYIQLDPDGDSYDIIAVDNLIIEYGDDYHDKIYHQFEGIKTFLKSQKIEFTVVNKKFQPIDEEEIYEARPRTTYLTDYLSDLSERGYVERI
jgi:hypothetical protein